jgi:hypothetical protein
LSDVTVSVTAQPATTVGVNPLGATGASAYALAVANGFDGTLEEWLATLGETPEEIQAAIADYVTAHLGNVDNTADADKPVSAAQQAALDGKSGVGHTHTSASITDFVEAVQDAVAAFFTAGANISVVYDDAGNTITVSATGGGGGDAELIRDTIGAAVQGVGNISVLYDDTADTITIATTATVNSTDAALRDRSTHTGTQSADTVVDSASFKVMTAAERTKLAGVATGATANDTDANLKSRANHTGTQLAATISDFASAADARVAAGITGKLDTSAAPELIRDTIGTALVAGSNVTLTVDDAGDTITIAAAASKSVRHDTAGGYDYTGSAAAGTADSASTWTITRINLASPATAPKHATGAWTGRTGLTYS